MPNPAAPAAACSGAEEGAEETCGAVELVVAVAEVLEHAADSAQAAGRRELADRHRLAALEIRLALPDGPARSCSREPTATATPTPVPMRTSEGVERSPGVAR